jgi:thiol:disulfide interchange protein
MARLRSLVFIVLCAFSISPALASSAWIDYSPESFSEAQAEGKTILVDVTADWCPTCKAQHPILNELTEEERMKDVLFVRVDFDQQKDFLKAHKIPRQSTILIFNGNTEVDRSIAETNRDRLRNFVFAAAQR